MISPNAMLSAESVHRLGWTLLDSLWQLAIAGVVLALLLAMLRRRNARTRYLVACLGLAAMFLMPLANYFFLPREAGTEIGLSEARENTARENNTTVASAEKSPLTAEICACPPSAASESASNIGPNDIPISSPVREFTCPVSPPPAVDTRAASLPRLDRAAKFIAPCVPWTVFVWVLGVIVMSVLHIGGYLAVRRLSRSGVTPVPDALARRFQELKTRLGVSQPVRLLQSILIEAPVAMGWLRPVILAPVAVLTGLAPGELDAVLAHELAHVRRYDYLVNLLQTVVETLLFYHPAAWWLSRRIRIEREYCCDDVAVAACGSRVEYAQALTTLEKGRRSPEFAMAATGGTAAGTTLSRVRRILEVSGPDCGEANLWFGGVIALALLVSLAVVLPLGHAQGEENAEPSPPKTAAATQPAAPAASKPDHSPQDVSKTSQPASPEVAARAIETKSRSWGLRHRRDYLVDGGQINLVGLLVTNGWWKESLPLAPAQASAIKKLDDLVQDALDYASLAAADYMDTNPPDYQEYSARFYKRHCSETFRHAERMTALGLLTEPQAALVMQRHLSGSQPLYGLREENVQDLLRMTESQRQELAKVGDEANRREARLNLWTVDPKEQEKVRNGMAANALQMAAAAMSVLTPSQRDTWSRLTAERHLPAKPPDLPAPTEAQAAGVRLEEFSPVFRLLTAKADVFKLSDPQKKLVHRLEEVTRTGLFWISRRNPNDAAAAAGKVPADRVTQARAEFVKEAEQIALCGILTEKQAEQVESDIRSKREFKTSLGSILLYCPPGSFLMGSPANPKDRTKAGDQVEVTISQGFYLGKYSVTQAEYKAVMAAAPWAGKEYVKEGDDYPATYVDWDDAAEFCRKLTARESQAGRLPQGYAYALPTEAQREYACRAGTTSAYSFGDDPKLLGEYAWYGGNAGDTVEKFAHRVGQRKPNPWGFYDLHGNVFEWCRDRYTDKLPGGTDPLMEAGAGRVNRGGCWGCNAEGCMSALRNWDVASDREDQLGFRIALVATDASPTYHQADQVGGAFLWRR